MSNLLYDPFLKTLALGFCLVMASSALSQSVQEPQIIKSPENESFRDVSSGLIIPRTSRQETCGVLTPNPEPPCREILSVKEQERYSNVSIYNADGSVWWSVIIWPSSDSRYFAGMDSSFSPIFPNADFKIDIGKYYSLIVMRIVRESKDWYEVEVNERSRKTRFVSKADPLWVTAEWYDLFNMSYHVLINPDKTNLLDAPNGHPIECKSDNPKQHKFSRLDGDWMLVNKGSRECEGWLRWRQGRSMLVGSRLTDWKVPITDVVSRQ